MKNLTRKHKMYLGVVGVGLLLVIIDQVFVLGGSGPDTTEAVAPPAQTQPTPRNRDRRGSKADTARPAATEGPDLSQVSQRLTYVSATHAINPDDALDAFSVSQAWAPRDRPKHIGPGQADAEAARLAAEQFARTRRLQAIVTQDGQPVAIVDNQLLRVGDLLGKARLHSIAARSVVFELSGQKVQIDLNKD